MRKVTVAFGLLAVCFVILTPGIVQAHNDDAPAPQDTGKGATVTRGSSTPTTTPSITSGGSAEPVQDVNPGSNVHPVIAFVPFMAVLYLAFKAPSGQLGWFIRLVLAMLLGFVAWQHWHEIQPHWYESWHLGAFFAMMAGMETGMALAVVLWPSRQLVKSVFVSHIGLIGLYFFVRWIGPPGFAGRLWHKDPFLTSEVPVIIVEMLIVILTWLWVRQQVGMGTVPTQATPRNTLR